MPPKDPKKVTPDAPEIPPVVPPEAVQDRGEKPGGNYVPAVILRNKGVPVTLYRTEHGKAIERPSDLSDEDDWDPPTRTFHLRFTANHVAEIEEAFDGLQASVPIVDRQVVKGPDGADLEGPAGPVYIEKITGQETRNFYGLEAFQKAMEVKMTSTVRACLAIAMGVTPVEAGNAMIPEQAMDYQAAVGVAWSIAQGVDPTEAAKVLQSARDAMAAAQSNLASELKKTLVTSEG